MGQPPFRVACVSSDALQGGGQTSKPREPDYAVDDEALFLAIRLAKLGYYGGDPDAVLAAPFDKVQNILCYEKFEADYEREYAALNAPKT